MVLQNEITLLLIEDLGGLSSPGPQTPAEPLHRQITPALYSRPCYLPIVRKKILAVKDLYILFFF